MVDIVLTQINTQATYFPGTLRVKTWAGTSVKYSNSFILVNSKRKVMPVPHQCQYRNPINVLWLTVKACDVFWYCHMQINKWPQMFTEAYGSLRLIIYHANKISEFSGKKQSVWRVPYYYCISLNLQSRQNLRCLNMTVLYSCEFTVKKICHEAIKLGSTCRNKQSLNNLFAWTY